MHVQNGAKAFIKNKKTGKFLFILRDNIPTIPYPNCWSIVGGGIEEGETPLEALKREIKEEIDAKVYNIKFIRERAIKFQFKNETKSVKGYLFVAHTDTEEKGIKVYEGQKAKYFTLDEIIKQKNTSPAFKKSIRKYYKLLEKF